MKLPLIFYVSIFAAVAVLAVGGTWSWPSTIRRRRLFMHSISFPVSRRCLDCPCSDKTGRAPRPANSQAFFVFFLKPCSDEAVMKKTSRDGCRFSARAARLRRVIRLAAGFMAIAALAAGSVLVWASDDPEPSSLRRTSETRHHLYNDW